MVVHLLSMCKAIGLTPRPECRKKNEGVSPGDCEPGAEKLEEQEDC